MGRPTLGDHVKLEIIIEESYEFKVTTWFPSSFSVTRNRDSESVGSWFLRDLRRT